MATDVTVVVPWWGGDPDRTAAFDFTQGWWDGVGCEVIVASGSGAVGIGGRVARAANQGTAAASNDLILLVGAETILGADQIEQAAELAKTPGLVVPFTRAMYLGPKATAAVLDEGADPFGFSEADCEWVGAGTAPATVFSRETWLTVRGFDESLPIGEDGAFAYACDAYFGPMRRVEGDVVHLWHPRPRESTPGTPEHRAAFVGISRYRDAHEQGPEAVRAMVEAR